jgi:hypothetical protein
LSTFTLATASASASAKSKNTVLNQLHSNAMTRAIRELHSTIHLPETTLRRRKLSYHVLNGLLHSPPVI